jgi:hypothetical protein
MRNRRPEIRRMCLLTTVLLAVLASAGVAGTLRLDSTDVIFHYHGSDTLSGLGRNIGSLGDINGDGFSDIAMSSFSPMCTYVFYGGDPVDTFPDMVLQGAFGPAQAIDVTGDGIDDIVVANVVGPAYAETGKIYFYRGYGDSVGSVPFDSLYPDSANYAFGTYFRVAYLDSDSLGDLLTVKPNSPARVLLLYYDVLATDTVADWVYSAPAGMYNFYGNFGFIDFNGDSILDIYVGHTGRGDSVPYPYIGVFLGPVFGSSPNVIIRPPHEFDSVLNPRYFGDMVANIGDFDGDGWEDLGVTYDGRGLVYKCGPGADTTYDYLLAKMALWLAGAGDVNGDGGNDLVVSGGQVGNGSVDVYLGGSECDDYPDDYLGRTDLPPLFLTGVGYRTSAAGDFNGDGIDDFMFSCRNFAYGQPNDVFVVKGGPGIVSGVTDHAEPLLPKAVVLSQNYPNPFNATTTIEFEVPRRNSVELSVYNVLGVRVVTILNDELTVGTYRVTWDAKNNQGQDVSSGVYLYRLVAGETAVSRKMLLLK